MLFNMHSQLGSSAVLLLSCLERYAAVAHVRLWSIYCCDAGWPKTASGKFCGSSCMLSGTRSSWKMCGCREAWPSTGSSGPFHTE